MLEMKLGKHWLCYAPVWFIAIICTLLIGFGTGKVAMLGWILFGFDILGYLSIRNYKWTVTNGELVVESGVLPWQKTYTKIPAGSLYGITVTRGFLGWFLDYGTITVNVLGGSSSKIIGRHMKGAQRFMESFNGVQTGIRPSSLENN
ncbi:MAG: PH domain-containing protein [Flavobacterium sp.]|uniref:PH domain-containing protein n=1 Tax=Flavobacterium sp. TaxID=239 RepID=UPI00122542DD|nr:PH domain-containing protein [Flavobacterium sp.]RZJ65445.1 MAG: PH domain-containing protein [Flavobacterium sp.]